MSESTATPAPATPEIKPVVSALSDFSDRISPMIVKELRQGMRTRTFTGIFLILQTILGFSMLIALMSDTGDTGSLISSMVFFLFSIVALILQPLRGTSAVATEMKDDTLEIMSLTRLSSVRIVVGKWASLVSQTALMLSATIPYLVMRYFFGGMQLFGELALLLTIFFLSVCLTAVTVGLSCNRLMLVRALVPLIMIPAGLSIISGIVFGREFGFLMQIFTFQDPDMNVGFLVFVILSAYVGYYILDMGVSRIAAFAENHAFRKRMVSLILMVVVLFILYLNPPSTMVSIAVILGFTCTIGLDVCTEVAVCVPSVVKPFVKRSFLGTFAGRFLYPGWHSGFFLLSGLFVFCFVISEMTFSNGGRMTKVGLTEEASFVIIGIFYSIFAPLLIVRAFIGKIKNSFTGFVGALLICAILTSLVALFADVSRSSSDALLFITSWVPGVWIILLDDRDTRGVGMVLTALFLAIVWLSLLLFVNAEFRNTKRLEKIAKNQLAEDEA
jgi:hypothetical protein